MRKTRILVVDDELNILKYLRANLLTNGYEVLMASDGAEALQIYETELPDLVILDIMMPKVNGFEVCRRLREWTQVPIIMLSAIGDEKDKVKCLKLGADDYITKPFGVEELLARVVAVLRRTEATSLPQPTLHSGNVTIDFAAHRVTREDKEVNLTATEYALLAYLAQNVGRVITPDQILATVWGEEYLGEIHMLQVNVGRLRQKLQDDTKKPKLITTKIGIGYMFNKVT